MILADSSFVMMGADDYLSFTVNLSVTVYVIFKVSNEQEIRKQKYMECIWQNQCISLLDFGVASHMLCICCLAFSVFCPHMVILWMTLLTFLN